MEREPIDFQREKQRRRHPTDVGGVALEACLKQAVEEQRITQEEAEERLASYLATFHGEKPPEPPDSVA